MKRSASRLQIVLTDILGVVLMIASLLLGWLPGPGGIPLFLAGLGLLAINHEWARKWLRDFDKKRLYYTEKFLVGSRRMKWVFDITSIILITCGVAVLVLKHHLLFRLLGTGLFSLGIIIILSNQKRFDRLFNKAKKKN